MGISRIAASALPAGGPGNRVQAFALSSLGPSLIQERLPISFFQSEEATLDLSRPMILRGMPLRGVWTVTLDSRLHIPRTVPIPVLAALKRLASFANPVFHENFACGRYI